MRRAAFLTLGFLAVTLVMASPFINFSALATSCFKGDARLIIWTLAWDNHAVLDGLPLFDSNVFYPAAASLGYNEHLFGISLFSLPIYAATRNPVLAYNILFLAAFVLNGLGMAALAWRHTRSLLAAFVAGLIFAFSFFQMHHAYGHLQIRWTWLLPLSVLLLERWHERPTWFRAALWTIAVVLEVLASWYLAVMVLIANGIVMVWIHAVRPPGQWGPRLAQLAVAVLAGGAIVWPFAAHYQSLARPELSELVGYSADWAAYFIPPENTLAGQWWLAHIGPGPRWIWGERTLFVGWIAIGLAAMGTAVVLRPGQGRWQRAGAYLGVAGLGLVASFGPTVVRGHERLGVYWLISHLPGAGGARVPARFSVLVLMGSALLASYGVVAIQRRFGQRGARSVAVMVPLILAEWFVVRLPGGPPMPVSVPAIYATEAIKRAHAIVSLPDYWHTADWALGSDYLFYSTSHWRPIVNGYGRTEPDDYLHVISHMNAFPGPNNAATMRRLGVDYVVLHAGRYRDGAGEILRLARESPEYDLVDQMGADYLFKVRQK